MSLFVALQSVLYYFVACSPCRQCAYRRRRKREAALVQRQRNSEMDVAENGLYRHPSPFTTNIYWREEMALGPGPPQKRSGKEGKGSQRRLLSAGPGSSMDSRHRYRSGVRGVGGSGGDGASVSEAQPEPRGGSGFHHDWWYKRHQREDEVLWGSELARRDGGGSSSSSRGQRRRSIAEGSSVGVTGMGRADTGSTSPESYYVARNPPVNVLHPPIVRTPPTNRNETRWMLQPPPKACVMNGKEQRVNRDRCTSSAAQPAITNRSSLAVPASRLKQEQTREAAVAAAEARMSVVVNAERLPCKKRRRLNGPRLEQDFIPYVDSTEATADAGSGQARASPTSPSTPLQEISGYLGQTSKVDSTPSHAKKGLLEAGQPLDRTTLEEGLRTPEKPPPIVTTSRGDADGRLPKPDATQRTSGSPNTKTARAEGPTTTARRSEASSGDRHAAPSKAAYAQPPSTIRLPSPSKFAALEAKHRPDMSLIRPPTFNTTATTTTTTTLRFMLKNSGRRASDAQTTELMAYRWETGSATCTRPSAAAFKAISAAAAAASTNGTAITATASPRTSSPPRPPPVVMMRDGARLPAPATPSLAFSSSFHFAASSPASPPSDLARSLSPLWHPASPSLSPSPSPSPSTTVLASTSPVPVNLHMDTKMSMMRWSMDI